MLKVYPILFSDTAPEAYKKGDSVVITGGKASVIRLEGFSEGSLARVAVIQTAGSAAAFAVDVVNSVEVLAVGEHSIPVAPGVPIGLYKVITSIAGSSGQLGLSQSDIGFPFINVDAKQTEAEPYLYLILTPTGAAGATTWDIAVLMAKDVN